VSEKNEDYIKITPPTENCGMSLRDYFAAKAMQGLSSDTTYSGDCWIQRLVTDSYLVADAMIAERDKKALEQYGK